MNRLCQSSYDNLEAVINFAGHEGVAERRLVHFYRDRRTGKWSAADVISIDPLSGGSIIQNHTKRRENQEHGDFEVVVLEQNGYMMHYTRDNTIPANSGKYAWLKPIAINYEEHPKYGRVIACYAAPLFQSSLVAGTSGSGTTLETLLVTDTGDVMHYRSRQHNGSEAIRHNWELTARITGLADGPVCMFQFTRDHLKALVPRQNNIDEFTFINGSWEFTQVVTTAHGPVCTFVPNPALPPVHMVMRQFNQMLTRFKTPEADRDQRGWSDAWPLPAPLNRFLLSPHHKEHPGNPMSMVSQSLETHGHSPNVEALVFHPCGTGNRDLWMVLHWSFLNTSNEWLVSGVVLGDVDGFPM